MYGGGGGERFRRALDILVNMQDAMGITQMTICIFNKDAKLRRHEKTMPLVTRKRLKTQCRGIKERGKLDFKCLNSIIQQEFLFKCMLETLKTHLCLS